MGAVLAVAMKDLRVLWRDRFAMFFMLAFPLIQALFFGAIFARGGGAAGRMTVAVVDDDHTPESQAFAGRLARSKSLRVLSEIRAGSPTTQPMTRDHAADLVRTGKAVAYLAIKPGFGEASGMLFSGSPPIEVGLDPSRSAEAGYLRGILMETYFDGIKERFSDPAAMRGPIQKSLAELEGESDLPPAQKAVLKMFLGALDTFVGSIDPKVYAQGGGDFGTPKIETVEIARSAGGPRSSYDITFPSAMLWGVIACTAGFAVSMVLERRSGTLLRLRVSPLTRGDLMRGKALACFIACCGVIVVLLAISQLPVFSVRVGSLAKLMVAILCTAECFVGLTMMLSVVGKTEQGVGGASWATLLICMMLGGGMIPLIAMPNWMVTASHFSPVKWGIYALEGAIWREFSWAEMAMPCAILIAVGVVTFSIGVAAMSRFER